ncbi:putative zinc finger c2h2-type protein [Neofusicoccum parvum UCRNP2]|uniref:Putative zinc finger c2h2-type protein n=1 Tax=Botryosphaeria parva (strain UCR-NP2) TaxID=1287680 RepID=R1FWT8_BOTPV|nr:putative zinc finger c2h2-type protein [Neofusicoccum parvum UCRNP2]
MEASTPRSPSQTSTYDRGFGPSPYAHPSNYPSPAKTEGDSSNYMADHLGLYNYPSMQLPPHSVHPAQTLASPSNFGGQEMRAWADSYESVARTPLSSWEQQFQYATSNSFGETRHSPALSDGHIISHRSSVSSSYDPSLYSQDGSESTFAPHVKVEPQAEWMSDEDSMLCPQTLTVTPERLIGHLSEDGRVNTSTARTRSRSATTKDNANYECKLCGKLFQRSYNHKAHMEIHDPNREYPHVCPAKGCERKFVHSKVRNHRCTACDAGFSRKDTLRRHAEDGCPKRFDVVTKQRDASARERSALPMSHHELSQSQQAAAQHMSSLGQSTPYFQDAFPSSPR